MKKAILFDLDGTLLPMDQDAFVKAYFGLLAERFMQYGYDPDVLIKTVWDGTKAMVAHGGGQSNEEVFWDCFASVYGLEKRNLDRLKFEEFYRTDFRRARSSCGFSPMAKTVVEFAKNCGYQLILATNPIFPFVATAERMRWAGLQSDIFSLITTYENSHACKPNPAYYREILQKTDLKAEDCLMVGNDVTEDGAAEKVGMDVFYLTDCLINPDQRQLSSQNSGSFECLQNYIRRL